MPRITLYSVLYVVCANVCIFQSVSPNVTETWNLSLVNVVLLKTGNVKVRKIIILIRNSFAYKCIILVYFALNYNTMYIEL